MISHLQAKTEKAEALQKKKDEAERKARRGEIDPTHEFTFLLVGQISGVGRHDIMQGVFDDPSILEDLDFFYKTDNGRKMIFYHQVTTQYSPGSSSSQRILVAERTARAKGGDG